MERLFDNGLTHAFAGRTTLAEIQRTLLEE